ncbi:hypothetical protein YN1HA_22520 [Sulfurisphaera ohwakuensis]
MLILNLLCRMLNLFYSRLSLTRRSSIIPEKIITIQSEEDLKNITEGIGRYEYSRGVEGKVIVDLTSLRGIEEKDDKLRILAGTLWKEVIGFKPELFGNLNFSVGGSVEYGDAGFGFNEFRFIKDRVEVEAYLNGEKYTGRYKGGIIYAVLVKKENKELIVKSLTSQEFDVIYYKLKSWFSSGIPPFRDITLVWRDGKFELSATYPKLREELLKKFITDLSDGKIIYEDLSFPHKYRYFGTTTIDNLYKIKDQITNSIEAYLRISFNKVYFSIYSNTSLIFPPDVELSNFSDTSGENNLNGCIMCGKCVDVCPYVEYTKSKIYSPLGFYVLQSLGSSVQINCHMCGKCVDVCPANLDIISDISKSAVYDINNVRTENKLKELKSEKVILITPISSRFEERILKSLLYLYSKGLKVGLKYIDLDIQRLVKNQIDWKLLSNQFSGINLIITITPEEYYYLQPLKRYSVLDIDYIENYVMSDVEIDKSKLHIPCYFRDLEKKIKPSKCSFAFLDLLNNKNMPSKINAEITLCPFTSEKLNIKTPLDIVIPQINLNIIDLIASKIRKSLENSAQLLDDAKWYYGIADDIYHEVTDSLFLYALKEIPLEEALILYFYIDRIDEFSSEEKKILEEKIIQLLTK